VSRPSSRIRAEREPAGGPSLSPRPLLVTADDALLDDLLRLAAAAGVDVDVAGDPGAARSRWPRAPLVVVGDDQAGLLVRLAPTRRRDVYIVGRDPDDAGIWRRGVELGAEQALFLPRDESWLAGRFADAAEGHSREAVVLGVVGGCGGAGASVLATGLSVTAARRGFSVVLVDLDPLGGGLDLVLGAEAVTGVRWADLAGTKGRLSARALHAELPGRHGLAVLSCGRDDLPIIPPEAADAVLSAARRACDLVVLDLPRWPDRAAEEAIVQCSAILLVVPAEVRAVAAASRVAATLTTVAADVRVVSRGPSSSGLDGADVASALGLPLGAQLVSEPRLTANIDRGEPPGLDEKGPTVTACPAVLDEVVPAYQARAA